MAGLSGDEWAKVKVVLDDLVSHFKPYDPPRLDAFADEPPEWAMWAEYGTGPDRCGWCGAWCEIVRPGKTQCHTCHDYASGLAIRADRILKELAVP